MNNMLEEISQNLIQSIQAEIDKQILDSLNNVVMRDIYGLRNATVQSHELCMQAVSDNGLLLLFVIDQTPEIVLAAIRNTIHAKNYINIPLTEEIEQEIILQSL